MCKLIKTSRLAGWLMYKGYILLRVSKDRNNSKYNIYVFRNDDGIEEEINNYVKSNGHRGGKQRDVVSRGKGSTVKTYR